ncbi:MAG: hypothetical protein FHK82_18205 [Sedimenticola thiotaurini]|uniref:Uncharacterized protein n=1 Tax=Sedimenticola thiotaurini TaxID=1543721 RepID=A0A558CEE4_9GAMM|nr:MAG: hypothetical protein FHK82_18205 [Sedimenticola thiotaurini]
MKEDRDNAKQEKDAPGFIFSSILIVTGLFGAGYPVERYIDYINTGKMHCVIRAHFHLYGVEGVILCSSFFVLGLILIISGMRSLKKVLNELWT